MKKKTVMTWISARKRWQKKIAGRVFAVSCEQLGCPPTKQASARLANQWWEANWRALLDHALQDEKFRIKWEARQRRAEARHKKRLAAEARRKRRLAALEARLFRARYRHLSGRQRYATFMHVFPPVRWGDVAKEVYKILNAKNWFDPTIKPTKKRQR